MSIDIKRKKKKSKDRSKNIKNEYGKKKIKVFGDKATVFCEILDFSPDMVTFELNTNIVFKEEHAQGMDVTNVNEMINKKVNNIFFKIIADCSKLLSEDIDYAPLKDITLWLGSDFETQASYLIRNVRQSKPIRVSFQLYLYTKNATHPNSFEVKFFKSEKDKHRRTPQTQSISDFIDAILNHELLSNNEYGEFKNAFNLKSERKYDF